MPTIVECQSCGGKLRVPDELLGRKVKCPKCSTVFQAGDSTAASMAPPPSAVSGSPPPEYPAPPPPSDGPVLDDLAAPPTWPPPEDERPWERPWQAGVRRDCEPHRGSIVLTLGIISTVSGSLALPFVVCCWIFGIAFSIAGLACGIPAIIMGRSDLARMKDGTTDPHGRSATQGGYICGIVGTSFAALALLLLVAFFVIVLVINVLQR